MKTLPKLVDEFLEYLQVERRLSLLTIRDYRHYLERFLRWLALGSPTFEETQEKITEEAPSDWKERIRHGPEQITLELIRMFRLYLSRYVDKNGLPLMHATQNYHIIALRSFLRYLAKRDISSLSAEKIDLPKTETRSVKFLDRTQIFDLLNQPNIATIQGLRDKALMELLFSTGLRVSELVSLNRDQINLDRGEFGVIGKGKRPRVVFLSEDATLWLGKYTAKRDDAYRPLFIRYSGKAEDPGRDGEPLRLTARSVQRLVEKYAKKARLPLKITPHGIRHSFATDLLQGGADLRSIQELLGHKNVSTTQIYTHVTNTHLRETHRRFHRKKTLEGINNP